MSKNNQEPEKKSKNNKGQSRLRIELKQETKYTIYAIVFFVLALLFFLASFGSSGRVGQALYELGKLIFGIGYFLLPATCILIGASFLQHERPSLTARSMIGGGLFFISSFAIIDLLSPIQHMGGGLGILIAKPFIYMFGAGTGLLVLIALLLIALLVMFDTQPNISGAIIKLRAFVEEKKIEYQENARIRREAKMIEEAEQNMQEDTEEIPVEGIEETAPEPISQQELAQVEEAIDEELGEIHTPKKRRSHSTYILPPLSLLEKDRGKPNNGDVKANANSIKQTLQNFGIDVEMDEITVGPTVTRYALKPAQGIKLSRILALQDDLSLSLAAHPLRIEAPIPGKSLVGIEVPNKSKATVGLGTLLGDETFKNSTKPLMVALGKNVGGKSIYTNLAKMPHGLIAGATGSGKSVTIHAIITSLLYRNTPEQLRLIFVDPKRVELTLYNKIPHLLTPVITDAKKAILALKWAAKEMDRRYDILEKEAVRDIESYSQKRDRASDAKREDMPNLPYIVIVIDELADIMQTYPRELESAIVRLAQMSRAVGIHLILSTQRPSVNVITGLIKANIPSRIALKVASQIDSRTILDQPGAEELVGQGDMLYLSGEMASPERIQCAYISEDEVKKVVAYIASENATEIPEDITHEKNALASDNSIFTASIDNDSDTDDDLYEEARQIVIETQKASTSFLQRKLGVGYARAARLIDMLEERGIVGPGNGAKPREVIEKSASDERKNFE